MKNLFYTTVGLITAGMSTAHAAITFEWGAGQGAVSWGITGSESNAFTVISNWLDFLVGFLYFICVAMMLWAGFQIITASGDEEKVKKWKSIIIQAAIGLIVIFIADSIVNFLIGSLFGAA